MGINIGSMQIGDIKIGSDQIASVRVGSTSVWENWTRLLICSGLENNSSGGYTIIAKTKNVTTGDGWSYKKVQNVDPTTTAADRVLFFLGKFWRYNAEGTFTLKWSVDGFSWNTYQTSLSISGYRFMKVLGNSVYLFTGTTIYSTTDMNNWTEKGTFVSGKNPRIEDAATSGDGYTFVVCGSWDNGRKRYCAFTNHDFAPHGSVSGVIFREDAGSGTTYAYYAVAYGNGYFLMVGYGCHGYYNSSGTLTSPTNGGVLTNVKYLGDDFFLACGRTSENKLLFFKKKMGSNPTTESRSDAAYEAFLVKDPDSSNKVLCVPVHMPSSQLNTYTAEYSNSSLTISLNAEKGPTGAYFSNATLALK